MEAKSLEIRISRYFQAPRESVFAQWLEAESLKDWFTPQTYVGISAKADARVGGAWQVEYQSPDGQRISEQGIYEVIDPPDRLVLTLTQTIDPDLRETRIFVALEEADEGGTLMHFRQAGFESETLRKEVAQGWLGCFEKLEMRLTR